MLVSLASRPGRPESGNEDWAGATASRVAVVLDGLTEASGTGCRHGTRWYVRQLGAHLLALAGEPGGSLAEALAAAISATASAHGQGCDLTHPGSPGATVAAIRAGPGTVEYLVLSDAVVVLDAGEEPLVVTDDRVRHHVPHLSAGAAAPGTTPAGDARAALILAQQRLRNRPDGYWVAQADPAAAGQALTGEVAGVRGALLLSDGAALLATDFGALTWRELLDLGYERGPDEIIAATRELERHDPDRVVWPRYKRHDDATAVVCRFDNEPDLNLG